MGESIGAKVTNAIAAQRIFLRGAFAANVDPSHVHDQRYEPDQQNESAGPARRRPHRCGAGTATRGIASRP